MKYKFREIQVSWRKGIGSRRKIIGVLKRTASGITFLYKKEGAEDAKKEGFNGYPGFPLDYNKVYEENNLDIFSLRLVPIVRKDNNKLISFWEAQGVIDKFDLLALTQGLLPTDNFEFLGKFNPQRNFRFVTDIAGLSYLELEKGTINVGDVLNYSIERNQHSLSGKAVKVYKNDIQIGFIKEVHNNIFFNIKSNKLKLTVKEVDQNGKIRNIFVLVDSTFK